MANLEDTDKRISRQRGKKIKIDGKEFTTQKERYLKDGTKVQINKFFGNPNNPMMNVTMPDGKRVTMNSSFLGQGIKGPSKISEKDTSQNVKRGESNFMKVFNEKADQIAKDTKDGKIKTLADLKNHPSYTSTTSGDIKNKLVGAFKAAGGDTSYTPVEKIVEKPVQPAPVKQPSAREKYDQQIKDQRSMSPGPYYKKYGVPLTATVSKPTSKVDRAATAGASGARNVIRGKGGFGRNVLKRFASGGMVNARNGAFIEIENKFSKRMLPGKKRTTRIY